MLSENPDPKNSDRPEKTRCAQASYRQTRPERRRLVRPVALARVVVGGGSGAALSSGMSGPEATKLRHVLGKLVAAKEVRPTDAAAAVAAVVAREYPEYARKPQAVLQKAIREALQAMVDEAAPSPLPMEVEGGASLNDSLRERYGAANGAAKQTTRRDAHGNSTKTRRVARDKPGDDEDSEVISVQPLPNERLGEVAGCGEAVKAIREVLAARLMHGTAVAAVGLQVARGVLVHGPAGCGKTLLCRAAAGSLSEALPGLSYFEASAPEVLGGGAEAEKRIGKLFKAAAEAAPSIIFLDDVDTVMGGSGSKSGDVSSRANTRLCAAFESLARHESGDVLVLAAAVSADALDGRLRRYGRFEREIALGVPDANAREAIVREALKLTPRLCADVERDYIKCDVIKKTPGWVGADLRALAAEAGACAARRLGCTTALEEIASVDLDEALKRVQPSFHRSGFQRPPSVAWDDVGAMAAIKAELYASILAPIADPERFARLGVPLPAGVLLYGPPGCGKTLVARAVAHESAANFIAVKGPELLDKYVGESERAVRTLFARAAASAPCIVFFDEIDALCPRRGGAIGSSTSDSSGSSGVSERVVNQLLTEIDGLESRGQVYVVAATNRPELVDPAMLRPGRIDKLLFVPLPTPEERAGILSALTKKVKLAEDVKLSTIANDARANGCSGADLSALVRDAGLTALQDGEPALCAANFDSALDRLRPSVSPADAEAYLQMSTRMRGGKSSR